jgi:hypothetical protein
MKRQTKIKRTIRKSSLTKRQNKKKSKQFKQSGGSPVQGFAFVAKYKPGFFSKVIDVIVKLSFSVAIGFKFAVYKLEETTHLPILLALAGYTGESTLEAAKIRIFPHKYKEIMSTLVKEETEIKNIKIDTGSSVVDINGTILNVDSKIIAFIEILLNIYKTIADKVKECVFDEKNNGLVMKAKTNTLKNIKKLCGEKARKGDQSIHVSIHNLIGKFNDIVNGKSPVTEEGIQQIIKEAKLSLDFEEIDKNLQEAQVIMLEKRLEALRSTTTFGGSRKRKRNSNKRQLNKNRTKHNRKVGN